MLARGTSVVSLHDAGLRQSGEGAAPLPAPASQQWRASRRLSSSAGVRMSAGAAAVPATASSGLPVAPAEPRGAGELVQRLSGRIGLGGGLSRLSLSISDALRRLSIRLTLTLLAAP